MVKGLQFLPMRPAKIIQLTNQSLEEEILNLSSQTAAGSVENVKTITSKEELHATDARKLREKKTVKENRFTCSFQLVKGKRRGHSSNIKSVRNPSFLNNSKVNSRIMLI